VRDDDPDFRLKVTAGQAFKVTYVGMDLTLDGFAVQATGDGAKFAAAIKLSASQQTALDLESHRMRLLLGGCSI